MRGSLLFWRRVTISAVCLVIARIGLHIPVPGVDPLFLSALASQLAEGPHTTWLLRPTSVPFEQVSIFALGIQPYLAAVGLTLLASGLVIPLRRLRDGDATRQGRFDRVTLLATGAVALVQAYGLSVYLLSGSGGLQWPGALGPGLRSAVAILSWTAGTLAVVWLAAFITRRGVGNGIALLVLIASVTALWPAIGMQTHASPGVDPTRLARLIGILLIAGLFVAATVFVRAGRVLRFVPASAVGNAEPEATEIVTIPLRVNIAGITPVVVAASLMHLPTTLVSFGLLSEETYSFHGSTLYWVFHCILIIVVSYLLTAWILNVPNMLAVARRYGFKPSGGESPEGLRARLERSVAWTTLLSALFLCLLSLVGLAAKAWYGVVPALAVFIGPTLLCLIAIVVDTWRQVKPQLDDEGDDWVEVLRAETRLELEFARAVLARHGIESELRMNRAICVTGSLAPWEACRPTYPALVVYRGLGGGRAALAVSSDELESAQGILKGYPSSPVLQSAVEPSA